MGPALDVRARVSLRWAMSQQRAVHDNLVLKMRVAKANRHVEWSSENSNGRFDDSVLRRTGTIHPVWEKV